MVSKRANYVFAEYAQHRILLKNSRTVRDSRNDILTIDQFIDQRSGGGHRRFGADCLDRRHRAVLQSMGQNKNAPSISARLQTGAVKSEY